MSGPDLTPGDPLGGGRPTGERTRPITSEPATPGERPPTGYTSARPPGAGLGADPLGAGPPAAAGAAAMAPARPQLELAGWWRRVGAQVIDGILIGLVALLFLIPLGIGAFGADTDGGVVAAIVGLVLVALVYAVVALAYAPLMMAKTDGRTIGRMATGIRVVRTNGKPMDFSTAALREIVFKAILIGSVANAFTLGLASLLDVLWPLWDEENRALHDFPVQTRTVLA